MTDGFASQGIRATRSGKQPKSKIGLVLMIAAALGGCSTYAAQRYSISADNVTALRSLNGQTVTVGPFTSAKPATEIGCRAVGPIKTPDGETFSEYVRKAFIDELKIANAYSEASPTVLTGVLDQANFSSMNGGWDLGLTLKSSNGRSLAVTEHYVFTSSWFGETACNQTAQAMMPAVQNLIGKAVKSPQFRGLVGP
ncbi:hypothetical protein [Inquilinus sp.]|jgi:hypothetical protein|uniref:hypothetical protein n=1 Tax=Inquilinus sp. TaxID=1932117 RepID=UPI003783284D